MLLCWLLVSGCGFDVSLGADDAGACVNESRVAGLRADSTFGVCGLVTLDVARVDNVGFGTQGLAIDGQGRALLAGTTGSLADRDLGVVRLTPAGAVDTSFGNNGVGSVSVAASDLGHGVLLQPDGTIVLVGESKTIGNEPIPVLGKLLANGQPDVAFGMGGHAKLSARVGNVGTCLGVVRRSDGTLICTGTSWSLYPGPGDLSFIAVDGATGQSALGFGTQGATLVDVGGVDQTGFAAVTTADGSLVLPGTTAAATGNDFIVARLASSGAMDATFTDARAQPGRITVDLEGNDDLCRAALVGTDGVVWCVGASRTLSNTFVGTIVRVLPGGALDPSFGTNGRLVLRAFSSIWAVLALEDGRFLIAGAAPVAAGNTAQALQVLDGAGGEAGPLVTFDVTPGPDSVRSLVRDGEGRLWVFGVANEGNGDWVLRRFVPERVVSGQRGECSSTPSGALLSLALLVLGAATGRRKTRAIGR